MKQNQTKVLNEISKTITNGDLDHIQSMIQQAVKSKIAAQDILEYGLISGMSIVGEKFRTGEMFIPEVMCASQAMHRGIEIISQQLTDQEVYHKGTVILGTVKGDIHDIGKTLVRIILQGGGFKVIDLGINVPAEKFIQEVKAQKAQILGLSALLSTSMLEMKVVIEELGSAELRDKVKVIIGGAPVTAQFARDIGADAYAPDAGGALAEVKKLLEVTIIDRQEICGG